MILSVSRRTDIPNYYSDWFFERMKEGFLLIKNPMNAKQISRIDLSEDWIDGMVFWTKNPQPMMGRLGEIAHIPYYFHFTVTPYTTDIEPGVLSKHKKIIPTFRALSEQIGAERVVWRYDPILLSGRYTVEYHMEYFYKLANLFCGYTDSCVLSFVDEYRVNSKSMEKLGVRAPVKEEQNKLAQSFAQAAHEAEISLFMCCEQEDFSAFGIERASCISKERLERISNHRLTIPKSKGQRPLCLCAESIDVGAYDTCPNGCVYCYANHSPKRRAEAIAHYDPSSPILCGNVQEGEQVVRRAVQSFRSGQNKMF